MKESFVDFHLYSQNLKETIMTLCICMVKTDVSVRNDSAPLGKLCFFWTFSEGVNFDFQLKRLNNRIKTRIFSRALIRTIGNMFQLISCQTVYGII